MGLKLLTNGLKYWLEGRDFISVPYDQEAFIDKVECRLLLDLALQSSRAQALFTLGLI